jgi:hypothetical protein
VFTPTRWQLATASGLTALVVLASAGTAYTATATSSPSNTPASGGITLVASSATSDTNSDAIAKRHHGKKKHNDGRRQLA